MATRADPVERWTPAGPIKSNMPMETIEQDEAHTKATAGEPAPLGLFGFATATFTAGAVLAGWFPATTILYASAVLFIFGGLAQFIAGMWSYRKGDTLAATAFGTFGAFNTTYALYLWLHHAGIIAGPGAGLGVVGIFIAGFGLIAGLLMVAAMWRNMALVAVLFFLSLAYCLIGASDIAAGAPNLLSYGGWAAIISSVIAFYTAGAMVINSEARRMLLPLGKAPMKATPPSGPAVVDVEPTPVDRAGWSRREPTV